MTILENKIALVTGGSRSLGKAVALQLAKAGADVCITYHSQAEAALQTAAEIEALGRKAAVLQVDLQGTANIPTLVTQFKEVLSQWGSDKFDILVNNAGIICRKPFGVVSEADLDAQYDTNFKSVFFLTQQLVESLNDGGRIINLGSGTTRTAFLPLIAYATIKSAVESLTQYLAKQLGERQITVNVVSPGALDTDFNKELFEAMPGAKDYIASITALGRVGVPQDAASVIAFLCSDEACWITGQRLEVSGGAYL
ncbi:SDR family NAD(P)-dependent oxidoreductase [Candidatus Leptofilum sp.]|uniref:SDR family NAD(P)-dependent oxidoreductase n=1 Tax=Candidatus Leptofilum sp. TaxID=3241576 RepID=UPI003B5B0848